MLPGGAMNTDLSNQLFSERIARARRTPPDQKMWDGPRLFAEACERMKDGLRYRHPQADEREIMELLRRQLALVRRLPR